MLNGTRLKRHAEIIESTRNYRSICDDSTLYRTLQIDLARILMDDQREMAWTAPDNALFPHIDRGLALRADIDEAAWSAIYSTVSRPFDPPKTGRIAVKVINHYGDEVLKTFAV